MFSRSSLVAVHLAYKIKNVVSKCSGVPSSVLANTLHGVRSGTSFCNRCRRGITAQRTGKCSGERFVRTHVAEQL